MTSSPSSLNMVPPKAASLLGLAVETRSEILKHLVGGVILHVSSNRSRRPSKTRTFDSWLPTYFYFLCYDVNADKSMMREKAMIDRRSHRRSTTDLCRCEYKSCEQDWDPAAFEKENHNAWRHFHMAIAGANRQMREETSWAFLEYNTFSFCEPVAWQQFRDEHTIAQLNHMRAIELYTMAATVEFEDGYGEGNGDPYARMPGDDWWRFDGVSILKNVTNIVLGFRDPPQRYNGRFNQNIDLIGRALDSAFGDLSGLKRLKDVNVFIIMDPHYYVYRQGNTMETNEQIEILLSLFGSKLEMKLLASNPHNIVQSTNHWENLDSMAISRLRGEQVEV